MFKKAVMLGTALATLSLGAIAVAGAGASAPRIANSTVLTEESNTGVTFTDNFNPLDSNSVATQMNMRSLTYEPLFEFDTLKAGVQYPWLATAYAFSNGGKTLTFTIRKGVMWSDGTAFTPADVAYTFNLANKVPAANVGGLPALTSPAKVVGDTVVLNYAAPEYSDIYSIAGTLIVPEHLWSKVKSPATATITNPVGTGPMVLKSYSSSLIKYVANPHYWKGKEYVTGVNVPSYSSNAAATTALVNGQLDWAGNDIANINAVFVSKNPSTNHYYFAPGNTASLIFNTTYGQLKYAVVRQAISMGINRTILAQDGESGYSKPVTSTSGLLPSQQSYMPAGYANNINPAGDSPAVVGAFLEKNGYKLDSNGYYALGGNVANEISFNVEDPTAYSDYYADDQLISNALKADHINATVDGVAASQWYTDLSKGSFQSVVHWGSGGVSPLTQYQGWLDYTGNHAGTPSTSGDFGLFKSNVAESLIGSLERTNPSNTAAVKGAVLGLAKIMTTQVPVAPLFYGPDWNVFSTKRFTGFVTASNQYSMPSPNDPYLPLILSHLTKA